MTKAKFAKIFYDFLKPIYSGNKPNHFVVDNLWIALILAVKFVNHIYETIVSRYFIQIPHIENNMFCTRQALLSITLIPYIKEA